MRSKKRKEHLNKIYDYLEDGTVVFFRRKGLVHKLITAAQSIYTKEEFGTKSMWGHIGIILNGSYYESTISTVHDGYKKFLWFRIPKRKKLYGVVAMDVSDKFNEKEIKRYKTLGFQWNFPINKTGWKKVLKKADSMVNNQTEYAGKELIGTFIRILKWKKANKNRRASMMLLANRFDSPNVYCIAFVADVIEASGLDYIDVHHSVSTVDEAWQDCEMTCKNKIIRL